MSFWQQLRVATLLLFVLLVIGICVAALVAPTDSNDGRSPSPAPPLANKRFGS